MERGRGSVAGGGGEGFRVYETPSPCFRVFKMDEKYLGDFLKPPKLSLDYFFSSPNWEVTITTQGDGVSLPFPSPQTLTSYLLQTPKDTLKDFQRRN